MQITHNLIISQLKSTKTNSKEISTYLFLNDKKRTLTSTSSNHEAFKDEFSRPQPRVATLMLVIMFRSNWQCYVDVFMLVTIFYDAVGRMLMFVIFVGNNNRNVWKSSNRASLKPLESGLIMIMHPQAKKRISFCGLNQMWHIRQDFCNSRILDFRTFSRNSFYARCFDTGGSKK